MRRQRKLIGSVMLVLALVGGLTLVLTGCGDKKVWITPNTPPVLAGIGPQYVTEGKSVTFSVSAYDPDGDPIILLVKNQPANSQFVDSGNGRGIFSFFPNYAQDGTFETIFIALDGRDSDSELVIITVVDWAFAHHTGNLTESETWTADSVHLVTGDIEIKNGAVLTMEEGCVVRFVEGKRIRVGHDGIGGLIAEGTIFTSVVENPTPGMWDGITFSANCLPSSKLDNCIIEYGGGNGYGNVFVEDGGVTITNDTLRYSSSNGIYFLGEGQALSFEGNVITDNVVYPATVDCNYLGRLTGSSLTGNGRDTIIVGGTLVETDATWDTLGVPFRITRLFEIAEGATLTIVPGNTLSFDPGSGIAVGKSSSGTLIADGTDKMIVFTSSEPSPEPGAWEGLSFGEFAGSGCLLDSCIIEYGAETQPGNIHVKDAEISVTNTRVHHSAQYGMYFEGEGRFSSLDGTVITDNALFPIRITAKYVGDLTDSTSYTGNGTDLIEVGGATLTEAATWDNLEIDYLVSGMVGIDDGGVLTLAAGDTLFFAAGAGFEIGQTGPAALNADGSAGTIRLTAADDANPWEGISFLAHTLESSLLGGCTIEYAGDKGKGIVNLEDCQVAIRQCRIANGSGLGIVFKGSAYPLDFEDNTITGNAEYPVSINCNYVGFLLPENDYSGNGKDAFALGGSAITASATWADPDVPYVVGDSSIIIDPGVQLTLDPGVEIQLGDRKALVIAENAALIADGSADQIKFTASSSSRWKGLIFQSGASSASILKNCLIENGGGETKYEPERDKLPGCVHVSGCVITITGCTITGSARNGIFFVDEAYATEFHGNTFTDNNGYPVRIDLRYVQHLAADNVYGTEDDTKKGVEIGGDWDDGVGQLTQSTTWPNLEVPYYLKDDVEVIGGAQLTLVAGTTLILAKRRNIIVGDETGQAWLVANGTAESPITFTSTDTTSLSYNWGSIWLRGARNNDSSLDYCVIECGGNPTPPQPTNKFGSIYLDDCSPSITNSTIRKSRSYGIYCEGSSSPTLQNNTHEDNSEGDLGGSCGP